MKQKYPPRITLPTSKVYDDYSDGDVDYISMKEHESILDKQNRKLSIAMEALEFVQDNSNSFITNAVRDAFLRIEYENER